MGIHAGNKSLELVAGEKAIAVGISGSEGLVNLSLEKKLILLVFALLDRIVLARFPLFWSEGGFPCCLICLEGGEKSHEALLLGGLLLFGCLGFDHLDVLLVIRFLIIN